AAGVPAARAAHARVELNGRDAGLYVLVEGYNKRFLKRHFGDARGNLYDSEFMHDVTEPLKRAGALKRGSVKALKREGRQGAATPHPSPLLERGGGGGAPERNAKADKPLKRGSVQRPVDRWDVREWVAACEGRLLT